MLLDVMVLRECGVFATVGAGPWCEAPQTIRFEREILGRR